MADPAGTRPPAAADTNNQQRIRDVAMACFAEHGVSATSLRTIADAADVSVGLIQHYFGSKAELVAAVDEHVLDVCGRALVDRPAPPAAEGHDDDPSIFRGGPARLFIEHPQVIDYLARVLPEGGATGAAVFDGLVTISATQGETFAARGLTRPDLDSLWSVLNPVLLRVTASVLRRQIERHLPGPLYSREQTVRWDNATTDLIRRGLLKDGAGGLGAPGG